MYWLCLLHTRLDELRQCQKLQLTAFWLTLRTEVKCRIRQSGANSRVHEKDFHYIKECHILFASCPSHQWVFWIWDTGEESVVAPRQEMLVKDSRKWRWKTETLNPINLAVIQLWQVGLIKQHKGKTNRLYLHRVAIIYYAYSYHRTNNCELTGATDSLSQQSFTLVPFITCGVAALIYGLVLGIHISRHVKIALSHLTLWPAMQILSKEKMYWTLFQQSLGEK